MSYASFGTARAINQFAAKHESTGEKKKNKNNQEEEEEGAEEEEEAEEEEFCNRGPS